MKLTLLSICCFAVLSFVSCRNDVGLNPDLLPKPAASECDSIKFSSNINPIIIANCNTPGCHDAGSGNGDFTTYAGIKTTVDAGSFKARVIDGTPTFMPPSGSLPADQIAKLKCWLDKGAPNN